MATDTAIPDTTLRTSGVFEEQGPSDLSRFAADVSLPAAPPVIDTRAADLSAQRAQASEREQSAAGAVAARAGKGGDELRTIAAARPRDLPPDPALPAAPSLAARPFLQPGEGLINQMNAVTLGLGQLAMGVGGLKGSAIAATAAYKGALEGWAKGDGERVDRSLAEWKASTDRMLAQHRLALDKFRARLEDHKATWDEALGGLQVDLKGLEWTAAAAAAERRDIDALLKEYETARYRHDRLAADRDKFTSGLAEKQREHDERMEESRLNREARVDTADANRVERAREADNRLALATRKFQQSGEQATNLTPEALEMHAKTMADTGELPAIGWGSRAADIKNQISNRAAAIRRERGDAEGSLALTKAAYKANKAELAKLQTQRGPVLAFAATAEQNLALAEKLSDQVDRTQYPIINRWLLSGENKWAGDPKVAGFAAATRTTINEYAKVTNSATGGGTSTDTARREIEDMLTTAQSPEQFRYVAKILRQEMGNRVKGYDTMIEATRKAISAGGAEAQTIRVRRKSDGQTGTLDAKDFDATKYERLP